MSIPPLVAPVDRLSPSERDRTARNASLIALGDVGQRRLRGAHVAVVGAGGLGSPVILALAAAGVGTISVFDDDVVESTNLQRQVLHRLADVGAPKVASAVRAAADLSPETTVHAVRERLTAANAARMLAGADLVIDGSDSFVTRELVAAACEDLGVPLVWGTVQAFDAQVTVFWSRPPVGAPVVLADLYPPGSVGEVPSCAQVGVLGSLCLQVGSLLATEAIKLITGIGEPLLGRVLVIDGLRARQFEVPLRSAHVSLRSAETSAPETDAPDLTCAVAPEPAPEPAVVPALVSVRELVEALASPRPPRLIDVREDAEVATGMIAGALHVPLGAVLADPAAMRDTDADTDTRPLVVVCQAGVRARRAAQELHAVGIAASVLDGGMSAWDAALAEPVR